MNIKSNCLFLLVFIFFSKISVAQNAPPSSGNAMAATKSESISVNNFTGIPSISLPIFNYAHHSGIGINISLDYFAGGIKVNEPPSSVGLGWNLNIGGIITRTVRGVPDDCPGKGYLYNPVLQSDERIKTAQFENRCIDGEQDIFQFYFGGRSGKFYIGKDSQCYITPLSKMKIKLTKRWIDYDYEPIAVPVFPDFFDGIFGTIQKFTATTEDGTKYVFDELESQRTAIYNCGVNAIVGCGKLEYTTAWHLTKIISYNGKDSIKINYTSLPQSNAIEAYQTASIASNGTITHSDTTDYSGVPYPCETNGRFRIKNKVPLEIIMPDSKKVQFYYSTNGQFRFNTYPLLQRIKIMDSVFRYGYSLNWDTATLGANSKDYLMGLNYYTDAILKTGYNFTYYGPIYKLPTLYATTFYLEENKRDHWGFYNAANNTKDKVPTIPGIYTGANREPNTQAIASTLSSIKQPNGGITYYDYENNDTYPYNNNTQSASIDISTTTYTNISIAKVLGKKTTVKLRLNSSRIGLIPITGTDVVNVSITNLQNSSINFTTTLSLKELFYNGFVQFECELPNGNYLLNTSLANGTNVSTSLLTNITWFTQSNTSDVGTITGGIRIKQIRNYDPFSNKMDTVSTYKYLTESGKSSGFLGLKPVYDYPYTNNTNNSIRKITSSIISDNDYAAPSTVGYSRVEVIKGTVAKNLGKVVYEFTNINDYDYDNSPMEYPYLPRKQKTLGWGLPLCTKLYDNTGRLIQKTNNLFSYISKSNAGDSNYCSLKTGRFSDMGDVDGYISQKYYPELSRVDLVATQDTFYHPDNSITTSQKQMYYDTNYNVIKVVTPYDINKILTLEKRIYYPYNYTMGGTIGRLRDSSIFIPVAIESWIMGDAQPRMIATSIKDFAGSKFGMAGNYLNPKVVYALETNAPIKLSAISVFDPNTLVRNSNLIKPQQYFTYDASGRLNETTNAKTNQTNTVMYAKGNSQIVASISNAKNADVAYSSFEINDNESFVFNNIAIDITAAITGKNALNMGQTSITKAGLNVAQTYTISYWTKGTVWFTGMNNFTNVALEQRNGWNFYSTQFTNVDDLNITGTGLIDELRLYPVNANMSTTCYNAFGEIVSTCDANNNIMYNEYDLAHRPKIIRDKDKNILKKYDYSDIFSTISTLPIWVLQDSIEWVCEKDTAYNNNGRVNKTEIDINPYSESYLSLKYTFHHIDYNRCPLPILACGTNPQIKQVGGVCQAGIKIITASIYRKVVLPNGYTSFVWVCTYHYEWTDGSISIDFTEQNATSCALTPSTSF